MSGRANTTNTTDTTDAANATTTQREKVFVLDQLERLATMGYRARQRLTFESHLEDMKFELTCIIQEMAIDNAIVFGQRMIVVFTPLLFMLISVLFRFATTLNAVLLIGAVTVVVLRLSIHEFDPVLEDLYLKYGNTRGVKYFTPELRFFGTLVTSLGAALLWNPTPKQKSEQSGKKIN